MQYGSNFAGKWLHEKPDNVYWCLDRIVPYKEKEVYLLCINITVIKVHLTEANTGFSTVPCIGSSGTCVIPFVSPAVSLNCHFCLA